MSLLDEFIEKRGGAADGIVRKAFRSPPSFDKAARSARFCMMSEDVDRYGDIVRVEGMEIDSFLANPVVLPFHMAREVPIGMWEGIEKITRGRPPRMEGTAVFLPEGELEMADRVVKGIQHGLLRGASVGFMPVDLKVRRNEDGDFLGFDIGTAQLFECSIVSIPANPRALVRDCGDEAVARRILEETLADWTRVHDALASRKHYEAAAREAAGNPTSVTVAAPAAPPAQTAPTGGLAWSKFSEAAAQAAAQAIAKALAEDFPDEAEADPSPKKRSLADGLRRALGLAGDPAPRIEPTLTPPPPAEPPVVKGSGAAATARLFALKARATELVD